MTDLAVEPHSHDFAEEAAIMEGILRMHSEEIDALAMRAALGDTVTSEDVLRFLV